MTDYGYYIVFAVAFVDQFGVPVPAIAILLAAGAIAGKGNLNLAGILGAATLGTVAADAVLYQLGRWRGGPVLRGLCSFSLAPDTCVRKTETSFERLGWKALVIAKFVPGLAFLGAPVAGVLRMPWSSFLLFDSLGALLYNVVVIGLGFLLHDQLDRVVGWFSSLGSAGIPLVAGAILSFWAWRIYEKQRIVRSLRARRLTPDELRLRLESPDPPSIVDLRSSIAFEVTCEALPGAIRLDPEEHRRFVQPQAYDDREPEQHEREPERDAPAPAPERGLVERAPRDPDDEQRQKEPERGGGLDPARRVAASPVRRVLGDIGRRPTVLAPEREALEQA